MDNQHIYKMSVSRVYPLYIEKVERKGRTKKEVDEVTKWLTGYSQKELGAQLKKGTDFETFFKEAPHMNPARRLVTGVVCGVRVEDIKEPTMQAIRYLDKLVDEIAKGRAMDKILRESVAIPKGTLTTCSRGHTFLKSKTHPTCPVCWPGRYKKK